MKDKLFRFALRLLHNVEEAEDAVQDAMIKIWSKREEWEKWQNREGYCMAITRNICLDRLRNRRSGSLSEENALHITSSEKGPEDRLMDKEMLNRIKRCINTLPEAQQWVIHLREMEGFSYNEIAGILEMSMEQVKVNLFRGRNAIRKLINKEEPLWNM